jgi:hypothetical protein
MPVPTMRGVVVVYLAGPMSGYDAYNYPAFDALAERLRREHKDAVTPVEVINPAENYGGDSTRDRADYMRVDFAGLLRASCVMVLPEWDGSRGASLEVAVARELGLPVFDTDWQPVPQDPASRIMQAFDLSDDLLEAAPFANSQDQDNAFVQHVVHPMHGMDVSQSWPVTIGPGGGDAVRERGTRPRDLFDDLWDGLTGKGGTVTGDGTGTALPPVSGEVRVTDPDTGGQKGAKLAELGAVDPLALWHLARVAGFGGRKYSRGNYMRGYRWSLSYDAMMRHALAFWMGEQNDPETGIPHMAAAGWHCCALISFSERGLGSDDRYDAAEPVE